MTAKKVALVTASFVVLLLVASVVYLQTLDWTRYKTELSEAVYQLADVRLEIDGDVNLTFLPKPALKADGLRLLKPTLTGETPDAFATIETLEVDVLFAPLFSGRVVPQQLTLIGMDLSLDQAGDGSWSVLSRDTGAGNGSTLPSDSTGSSVAELSILKIEGSRIRLAPLVGEAREVVINALTLDGRIGRDRSELTASLLVDETPLRLSATTQPTLNSDILSVRADIAVSGGDINVTGRGGFAGGSARLSGAGDNAARFAASIASLAGFTPVDIASTDFGFDMSVTSERPSEGALFDGQYEVAVRQISLGDSAASADLMVAYEGKSNRLTLNGAIDSSVLDLSDLKLNQKAIDQGIETASNSQQAAQSPTTNDTPTSSDGIATQIATDENTVSRLNLSGEVALDIAALKFGTGVVQQVSSRFILGDSVIGFEGGAILPGATTIRLDGFYAPYLSESGERAGASLYVQSAQLRDLLNWTEFELPIGAASDRFSTASLNASIAITDQSWRLTNIEGELDSSTLTGTLSGALGVLWPTNAQLKIDRLPLAAWMEGQSPRTDAASDAPARCWHPDCLISRELEAATITLEIGTVYLGARQLKDVQLDLAISKNGISLSNASANLYDHGRFLMKAAALGSVTGRDRAAWSSDLTVSIEALHQDPLIFLGRALGYTLSPSVSLPLSGELRAVGLLEDLGISIALNADDRSYTGSGTAEWGRNQIALKTFQGRLQHPNLLPLLTAVGAVDEPGFPLPLMATFALRPEGSGAVVTSAGSLAELGLNTSVAFSKAFQLQTELSVPVIPNWTSIDLSLNTEKAAMVTGLLPALSGLIDPSASISAKGKLTRSGQLLRFNDLTVLQPDRQASGSLSIDTGARSVTGRLVLDGFSVDESERATGSTIAGPSTQETPPYSGYSGRVVLSLINSTLFGQTIELRDVPVGFAESGFSIEPTPLTINGQPATFSLTPVAGAVSKSTLGLKAQQVAIGPLLTSLGYVPVVSGAAEVDVTLSGFTNSFDQFIPSLDGAGTIKLTSGSYTGVDSVGLSSLVGRATSPVSLIRSIPGFLGQGASPFRTGEIQFRADNGVFLLDRMSLEAAWGNLSLDGQVNVPADVLRLQGTLDILQPRKLPTIPIAYAGSVRQPRVQFGTEQFLSVAQLILADRLRGRLASAGQENNPDTLFTTLFGAGVSLLKKQAEQKALKEGGAEETPDG